MQRWLIKVPFTSIFRPGIIIKLMVVEGGGRLVGTSWVLFHSGFSFIHQSPVHHLSGHRPAGGEPDEKTAGYLKEWIRAWFKRYSSSSFWRVLEGPWESAQEVLVCFVETLSLVWFWEKGFLNRGWIVLFAASSAAVQKLTNRVVQDLHMKASAGLLWWGWFSQSVRVSAPTERRATRCRGRLGSEAESCWHKLAFSWLSTTEGTRRQTSSREELRPPLSGRLTVSVWVRGQIWLRWFECKPEPLRSWV